MNDKWSIFYIMKRVIVVEVKTGLYGLIQKGKNGKTKQRTRLVVTSCEKTGRFIQFTERSPLGPVLFSVFVRFSYH